MINKNIIDDLNKNDLISYKYLYSREKERFGIVINIQEDLNFGVIIEVLDESGKISIPSSIIEYRKLKT